MDNEKLEQFRGDVKKIMEEILDKSELFKMAANEYGLGQEAVQVQVVLNLNKMDSSNELRESLMKDSSIEIIDDQFKVLTCCTCPQVCCK